MIGGCGLGCQMHTATPFSVMSGSDADIPVSQGEFEANPAGGDLAPAPAEKVDESAVRDFPVYEPLNSSDTSVVFPPVHVDERFLRSDGA